MLISLPSILNWIRHHVFISLGIVLLAALVIWGVGPTSFAVTHINMQHCGSLYSALGPQPAGGKVNRQAVRAIDCFVLAHQQCVAASLSYSTHSLDTGTQDTYYTSNSLGGCGLSGHTSSYVDVLQGSSSDFSCSGLQQHPDGLHFLSCGRFGEQIIPVSASV